METNGVPCRICCTVTSVTVSWLHLLKKEKLELVSNRLMDVEEDDEHISIKDVCSTFYNFDLFIFLTPGS